MPISAALANLPAARVLYIYYISCFWRREELPSLTKSSIRAALIKCSLCAPKAKFAHVERGGAGLCLHA